jgi:uncharacterized membrane protein
MKRRSILSSVPVLLPVAALVNLGCDAPVLEPDPSFEPVAQYAKPPKPGDDGGSLAGTDLGTLGGESSVATDISPEGWVVGYSFTTGIEIRRPFLSREVGDMQQLPLPPRFEVLADNEGVTYPLVINGQKMIAGAAPDPDRPDPEYAGLYEDTPIVWTTGDEGVTWTAEELPLPDFWGGIDPGNTHAVDLNDLGILVANYWEPRHGSLVWDITTGNTAQDWILLQEPAGALWTRAKAINHAGVIVGYSRMYDWGTQEYHAEYWLPPYDGPPILLPQHQAWPNHQAHGIQDDGDIVGWAQERNKKVALIWRNLGGSYGTPEVVQGPEMAVSITLSINACDQIVGGDTTRDQDGSLFNLESVFPRGDAGDTVINDMGWISGTSSVGTNLKGTLVRRATLWKLPGGC